MSLPILLLPIHALIPQESSFRETERRYSLNSALLITVLFSMRKKKGSMPFRIRRPSPYPSFTAKAQMKTKAYLYGRCDRKDHSDKEAYR